MYKTKNGLSLNCQDFSKTYVVESELVIDSLRARKREHKRSTFKAGMLLKTKEIMYFNSWHARMLMKGNELHSSCQNVDEMKALKHK